MKPEREAFEEAVQKYRGCISKVARAFKVSRQTIMNWCSIDEEFKQVVQDARMRLFDDCLLSGEMLALGVPIKDEQGKFIGWEKAPDGQMLRYFISILGRKEGFGDTLETALDKPLESAIPKRIDVNIVYNSADDLELQPQNHAHIKEEEE